MCFQQESFTTIEKISHTAEESWPKSDDSGPKTMVNCHITEKSQCTPAEETCPKTEEAFPIKNESVPITEEVWPTSNDSWPSVEKSGPTMEESCFAVEESRPIKEEIWPTSKERWPTTEAIWHSTHEVYLPEHVDPQDTFMKRQNRRVCKVKNCKYCISPPCGTCGNCLHPERRKKCRKRYISIN
jgi:hypothetical protein